MFVARCDAETSINEARIWMFWYRTHAQLERLRRWKTYHRKALPAELGGRRCAAKTKIPHASNPNKLRLFKA